MPRYVVCVAFLAVACPLAAQEPDARTKAFLDYYETQTARLIDETTAAVEAAKKELDVAKKGTVSRQVEFSGLLPNGRMIFPNVKEKNALVKTREDKLQEGKDQLAALQRGDFVLPKLSGKFRTGDFGTMALAAGEVLQVVDEKTMIVEGRFGDYIPYQERGPNGMRLALAPPPEQTVWITGFPTASLADGVRIDLKGKPMAAMGNKTYTTVVGGSKTVLHLEAIDVEAAKRAWKGRGR